MTTVLLETQFQDYESAKEHYQRAVSINPSVANTHYNLVLLYYNMEQKNLRNVLKFEEAIHHYKKAISLDFNLRNEDLDEFFGI